MAQNGSKLIEKVVKGSFHQGDTSVFGQNFVGRQCVANCVIAGLYNSIYWYQSGQLIILIIYCCLVINYTKVYQKQILCCKFMILVHK